MQQDSGENVGGVCQAKLAATMLECCFYCVLLDGCESKESMSGFPKIFLRKTLKKFLKSP